MRPAHLPAELGEHFAVHRALDAGVAPSRLRARDLHRPFHGVRTRVSAVPASSSPEARLLDRVDQYARRMTSHEYFSHVAAAVIWGLPLPAGVVEDARLDVAVPHPRRAPAGRGVRGHALSETLVNTVTHPESGVAVASVASTWAMLGQRLRRVEDLVAVADAAVRVPLHRDDAPALASVEQLVSALDAGRRIGRARLEHALGLVCPRSRSRAESWARVILIEAGLPEPEVNFDVFAAGLWLAQVDLAYPEERVAIEYEGEYHLTDPVQWAKDIARVERLVEVGWRVLRVTKGEVFGDRRRLVTRVQQALAARR